MEKLKLEVKKYIRDDFDAEWNEFSSKLSINEASKREIIFRQTDICDKVIYILEGIAASEYNVEDKQIISRFFQNGNLCSNMVSAVSKTIQPDNVIAITHVKYIEIPFDYFIELYLNSHKIGIFFRKKIIEHLIEAKNFISIKTSTITETQYAFLEKNYPSIIKNTPSKYIAAFIGITPEALSRFLKQRYSS
jgi:CRP-like cAMP-binding protein